MLIRKRLVLGLAVLRLAPALAMEAQPPRTPVEQFAPLLRVALASPQGTARGRLAGRMAAAFNRQFGTGAPVDIDVSTVVRYAQQGCARLRIDVSQQGVILAPGAAPQAQHVRFELNYCSDGLPPRSLATGAAP